MRLLALLTVPVLYVFFSALSWLAGLWGLLTLATRNPRHLSRVAHAMDCLGAAMLSPVFGWDGRSTISKECGRDTTGCRFCKILCKVLHYVLEEDHCKKEAAR